MGVLYFFLGALQSSTIYVGSSNCFACMVLLLAFVVCFYERVGSLTGVSYTTVLQVNIWLKICNGLLNDFYHFIEFLSLKSYI